ncbi:MULTISPECIES: hypothetical protein [Anaeromyxobacter]|uniref:hypothetical protein n=1 Tax=Anaeromyxobacter TaxID=161492 RepID=UPI001F565B8A|nr:MULTISPECIES: hypothetical protein [unclassified Anaeromyxobacter]
MSRTAAALLLLALASPATAVEVRSPPGALHGFPSMSDARGAVVADGELSQERRGDRLVVHARWVFRDGRRAEETDTFRVGAELEQERFAWIETLRGEEQRRFEVDFATGEARSVVRRGDRMERERAKLDLPAGRSFAGYGTALAASQLPLEPGGASELTFVAFTPKPRVVTLVVRDDGPEDIPAAERRIACDRFTLHPKLPLPLRPFVHAPDAHLWFTRRAPRALVRAEQELVAKDDPRVVIDVIPRGSVQARSPGRRSPAGR